MLLSSFSNGPIFVHWVFIILSAWISNGPFSSLSLPSWQSALKSMYFNPLSGGRIYINLGALISAQEYNFCWQELMCSDPERISVDHYVIPERIYFLWEELVSGKNSYALILKRFLLSFFVFSSWKDLFLSNMKDFRIQIQNATETHDFQPIFQFNF